jgi:hypothetical protein
MFFSGARPTGGDTGERGGRPGGDRGARAWGDRASDRGRAPEPFVCAGLGPPPGARRPAKPAALDWVMTGWVLAWAPRALKPGVPSWPLGRPRGGAARLLRRAAWAGAAV